MALLRQGTITSVKRGNSAVSKILRANQVVWQPAAPTPEDSHITDFASAIVGQGSTLSSQHRTAHDTYIKAAKASGTWGYIQAMWTVAGETFAGSVVAFKQPAGASRVLTTNGLGAGNYTATAGLQGGSGRSVTAMVNPSALGLSVTGMGLWAYVSASMGSTNQTLIGQQNTFSSATNYTFLGRHSSGTRIGGTVAGALTSAAFSTNTHTGLLGMQCEGDRFPRFYDDGVLIHTSTTAAANTNINSSIGYMCSRAADGQTLNNFLGVGKLFVITDNLPANLVATFSNELNQLLINMGRA